MNKYLANALKSGIALSLLCATGAQATTAAINNASVTRTLIDSAGHFGGCMAALSINPAASLPNCNGFWISFSCDGTYATKDYAYRMLEQAQIALALDKKVFVIIDDTKKHNGYCYASRIDLIK